MSQCISASVGVPGAVVSEQHQSIGEIEVRLMSMKRGHHVRRVFTQEFFFEPDRRCHRVHDKA